MIMHGVCLLTCMAHPEIVKFYLTTELPNEDWVLEKSEQICERGWNFVRHLPKLKI